MNLKCFIEKINIAILFVLLGCTPAQALFGIGESANVGTDWTNTDKNLDTSGTGNFGSDLSVGGNATITGTGIFGSDLSIGGNTNITGNTAITGTLTVDGSAYFNTPQIRSDYDYPSLAVAVSTLGAVTPTRLMICQDNVIADGTTLTQTSNIIFDYSCGGSINGVAGGAPETFNADGLTYANPVQSLWGSNLIVSSSNGFSGQTLYSSWWSSIENLVTAVGDDNVTVVINNSNNIPDGETVTTNANTSVYAVNGGIIDTNTTGAIVFGGPFDGDETVHFIGPGAVSGLNFTKVVWFDTGAADDTSNIQFAIDSTSTKGTIEFGYANTYKISGDPAIIFDRQFEVKFNGCQLDYNGHGTAITFGSNVSSNPYYEASVSGHVRVIRIEAIDHTGTETAASQLLGTGIRFCGYRDSLWKGPSYVYGFKYGYEFSGLQVFEAHNMQSQDCLVDFFFHSEGTDSSYATTAIDLYNPKTTFNPAFYSTIVGSRHVLLEKDDPSYATIDGIVFHGGVLQNVKESKMESHANWVVFTDVYWDAPLSTGYDFIFGTEAAYNKIRGGTTLVGVHIQDLGTKNSVEDARDYWVDKQHSTFHFGMGNTDLGLYTYQNDTFAHNDYQDIPITTTGIVSAVASKSPVAIGDATTSWNVTNTSGTTYRYTWDTATGTDPGLAGNSQEGTVTIAGGTLAAGNIGTFPITGTGTNWFEVTNPLGVGESGKTADTMDVKILEQATWAIADGASVLVSGTPQTSASYSAAGKISLGNSGTIFRLYNRMSATVKLRYTIWQK